MRLRTLQRGRRSIVLVAAVTSLATGGAVVPVPVLADDPSPRENRVAAQSVSPHAAKSLGNVIRTDDRG